MRKLGSQTGGSVAESAAVTLPATGRPRGPRRWTTARPLLSVLLLTYALTWVVLVPIAMESHGWLPVAVPTFAVILAAWGPAIAAALGGRGGLRAYIGRLLCWRVYPGWYVVVLVGPAAYLLAGIAIARLLGWSASPLPIDGFPPAQVALSLVLTLLLATLINTEEFAWRGLALPLLQSRCSALAAASRLEARRWSSQKPTSAA
jgi:uncharacterized protein